LASTSVTDPLNLGLSGLASGIDTSAVVDALMNVARQPQTALQHKKDQANARSTALGAIKAELNSLKGLADDLSSPGLYANVQTAFSSDSSKVDVVKTSGAGTGGTSLTVSRLASSQQRSYTYAENDASGTTIDFGSDASGKPYSQLSVPAGTKISDLATLINGASNIPVYAAAIADPNDPTGNTQLLVLSSRTPGSGGDFSVKSDSTTGLSEIAADAKAHTISTAQQTFDYTADPSNTTSITIGAKPPINIAPNATVDDVITAINGAGADVTASKDSNNRLVLTSNTAGSAGNFSASGSTIVATPGTAVTGQDSTMTNLNAQYSINGGPNQYATSNIVSNAIPGLQLTLKAVSSDPVTITVSSPAPDTDAIKQKVHDFVDSYNALMSDLNSRLSEKPVIPPSTDNDYLKGLFFGDSLLSNIQDRLRTLVSSPIGSNSSLNMLSQIGVSTGATTGDGTINQDSVDGKLTIDDDQLSSMLASDPTSVQTLLGGTLGTSGFSQLIDGALDSEVQAGGDFDTLISQANGQVSDYADQISDWDLRLSDQQDRLKAQFSAMEAAMAKSQTTQSWLTGQVAGLQANR
jgi:flagellar hook-associated protein 2